MFQQHLYGNVWTVEGRNDNGSADQRLALELKCVFVFAKHLAEKQPAAAAAALAPARGNTMKF